MKIETEVELTIDEHQKHLLWGIFHHHIHEDMLDKHETKFRSDLLSALDPHKEYEVEYDEIQTRTG